VKRFLGDWAEPIGAPDDTLGFPRRIRRKRDGAEMRLVSGASYLMGAIPGDRRAAEDERPRHPVTLGAFYVDVTEVTNAQFASFAQQTGYVTDAERAGKGWIAALPPPDSKGGLAWRETAGVSWRRPRIPESESSDFGQHPVVLVSWRDAMAFAKWVNCSLPTEAQFEFLLRAGGSDNLYPWGNGLPPPPRYGNFADESLRTLALAQDGRWPQAMDGYEDGFSKTAPVGRFVRDAYGLFDVSGNVWELCLDAFDAEFYGGSTGNDPVAGPLSPVAVDEVVRRGGAWMTGPGGRLRCSWRGKTFSDFCSDYMGFRCARSIPGSPATNEQR
jgi:formylglycine-generating enzyme required for sulfatase activity